MRLTGLTILTVVIVVLVGIGIAVGVWRLESRRRLRRSARDLEDQLRERFRLDPDLVGAWIVPVTRTPILRGPVDLDLVGHAPRDQQRQRALALARAAAEDQPFAVQIHDHLDDTEREGRRTA